MKRTGYLYDRIAEPETLRLAFSKAIRGKQGRIDAIKFRNDLEGNIRLLAHQLTTGQVDIGHYHFFHVRDPKKRLICAASFPERVLHHAIMHVCEPVFERYAIYDSYACRRGKGVRKAIQRCCFFSRRSSWYLKLDIHKYFDSIDHEIMAAHLAKRFKDRKLRRLFSKILETYHTAQGKGMPIGNLISQHLANFYLGSLDHWLKEQRKIKGYLRYMDDCVLFSENKQKLRENFTVLEEFLQDELGLQVKDDWILNRCKCGIPFLGFRIFPGKIMLGKRSKMRFKEKFRCYEQLYQRGVWTEEDLSRHVTPLVEFTKAANSFAFRRNMLIRYGVVS